MGDIDTSAEALEESIFWLKAKYRRHGEIEDRIAAEQLEYFQAEKRRAREGVTDAVVDAALDVYFSDDVIWREMESPSALQHYMRAALEAVWPDGRDTKYNQKRLEAQIIEDLDTLRPEVREAMFRIEAGFQCDDDPRTIRAELLRLADENETLERAASKHVLRCIELQAILDTVLPKERAASERAEKAEAELAALRARLFHGIVLDVDDLVRGHAGLPLEWRGKRVRLVVED